MLTVTSTSPAQFARTCDNRGAFKFPGVDEDARAEGELLLADRHGRTGVTSRRTPVGTMARSSAPWTTRGVS